MVKKPSGRFAQGVGARFGAVALTASGAATARAMPVAKVVGIDSGLTPIGDGSSIMASLFGSGDMFAKATADRLYPGEKSEYQEHFTVAFDQSVAGLILAADRQEILDLAAVGHGAH